MNVNMIISQACAYISQININTSMLENTLGNIMIPYSISALTYQYLYIIFFCLYLIVVELIVAALYTVWWLHTLQFDIS